MEYRNSGQLEFRIRDKTAGIVEARTNQLEVVDAYVSVFASGFWDRVVAQTRKYPKILVDHEGRRAGRITDTKEVRSADGLFQHCTMQYDLESRYGAEAFHDILSGSDDEFSHGFVTAKQHVEKRDGHNVTLKDECKMWPEVSQVLAGASPGTGPISVRSALKLLGLPDLRATAQPAESMPAMQANCPYCSGAEDGATAADCTCDGDCGAANCPQAANSESTNASGRAMPLISASSTLALDTRAGAAISAANRQRLQTAYDAMTKALIDMGVLGSPSEEADEPADQRETDTKLQEFRTTLAKMGVEL